jgi:hypothetical protein
MTISMAEINMSSLHCVYSCAEQCLGNAMEAPSTDYDALRQWSVEGGRPSGRLTEISATSPVTGEKPSCATAITCLRAILGKEDQPMGLMPDRAGSYHAAEVDERYVQKQLGRSSAEMTRKYHRRRDRFGSILPRPQVSSPGVEMPFDSEFGFRQVEYQAHFDQFAAPFLKGKNAESDHYFINQAKENHVRQKREPDSAISRRPYI